MHLKVRSIHSGLLLVLLACVILFRGEKASAITVTVVPDTTFQTLFETYGNDNTLLDDWTGSDGVLSVVLPDGRVLWDFSDTFLGLVNADGSRPPGQPFINNSMIIQEGDSLVQTLHGGTPAAPTSLFISTERRSWYWVGDMINRAEKLQPQRVATVGINTDAKKTGEVSAAKQKSEAFRKGHKISFAWLVESAGRPFSKALEIDSIPRAVLISPDGHVLFNAHPDDSGLGPALKKIGVSLSE